MTRPIPAFCDWRVASPTIPADRQCSHRKLHPDVNAQRKLAPVQKPSLPLLNAIPRADPDRLLDLTFFCLEKHLRRMGQGKRNLANCALFLLLNYSIGCHDLADKFHEICVDRIAIAVGIRLKERF